MNRKDEHNAKQKLLSAFLPALIVLAMFALLIPNVAATPTITISPDSGPVGNIVLTSGQVAVTPTVVTVTGQGLPPAHDVRLYLGANVYRNIVDPDVLVINPSILPGTIGYDVRTDATGFFKVQMQMLGPNIVEDGRTIDIDVWDPVLATTAISQTADPAGKAFTINTMLVLDPSTGPVGTASAASGFLGTGYFSTASDTISNPMFDGLHGNVPPTVPPFGTIFFGGGVTNPTAAGTLPAGLWFNVPNAGQGNRAVTLSASAAGTQTATFNVTPEITINGIGPVGSFDGRFGGTIARPVVITGTGFAGSSIPQNNIKVGSLTGSTTHGAISVQPSTLPNVDRNTFGIVSPSSFLVNTPVTQGVKDIIFSDGVNSNTFQAISSILPLTGNTAKVELSSSSGSPDSRVVVYGSGFGYAPNSNVAATDADAILAITLVGFNANERYVGGAAYAAGNPIYRKGIANVGAIVEIGDTRLSKVGTYNPNTVVQAAETDVGNGLVAFGATILHEEHVSAAPVQYDAGEYIYDDVDGSGTVSATPAFLDIRLSVTAPVNVGPITFGGTNVMAAGPLVSEAAVDMGAGAIGVAVAGDVWTDANGAFAVRIRVPIGSGDSIRGTHTVGPTGTSADFNIVPRIIWVDDFAGQANRGPAFGHLWFAGDGFNASRSYTVTFDSVTATVWPATNFQSDAQGRLISVPGNQWLEAIVPDMSGGAHSIKVTDTIDAANTVTDAYSATRDNSGNFHGYFITPRIWQITPNPGVGGPAGTSVRVDGDGLVANTQYSITYDEASVGTVVKDFTANSQGHIPLGTSFLVPAALGGRHIVDIQEKNNPGVSVLYTNQAPSTTWNQLGRLLFTPSTAQVGDVVSVSGSGLPTNTSIDLVDWNLNIVSTFTSTTSGTVPSGVTMTVPFTLDVDQNAGISAGATAGSDLLPPRLCDHLTGCVVGLYANGEFYIKQKVTLAPTSGQTGTQVTLSGSGLSPAAVYLVSLGEMFQASTSNPPPQNIVILGQFAADGQGLIPPGIVITIPSGTVGGSNIIDVGSLQLPPGGIGTRQYVTTLFQPKPTFTVAGVLTRIAVTPAVAPLAIGAQQQFVATGYDASNNALTLATTWSSSNTAVGTVDAATGLFTAVANGSTTVRATDVTTGINGTAVVTIGPTGALVSITVSPSKPTLNISQTVTFAATGTDSLGNAVFVTPTWTLGNNTVGTITSTGLFTASVNGTTTVTATSGTISGNATVRVGVSLIDSYRDPVTGKVEKSNAETAVSNYLRLGTISKSEAESIVSAYLRRI